MTHDGLALVETADTIPPTIVQGAFLTLGDGKLIIQGSETILNTSVSFSGMRVTNNTGESTISLDGASLVPSVGSTVNFTIQLTELQRVSVIAISGTPGGDGSATTLDIDPNQVTDVALNPNVAGASVTIHEDPDIIIPFFTSGEINLSTGVLKVVFSETIDLTPISLVNTSKFSISNVVDGEFVNLFGAIASGFDLPTVTITLTEAQRVKAIEMSGQPGGDGNAQFVSANLGAVQDVSRNQLGANNNVTLSEVPDTVFPKLVAATINLGTKTVFITLSETIDSTPKSLVSLSRISILNASDLNGNTLSGGTVQETDGINITVAISEAQRAAALYKSKTPGGDYSGTLLRVIPDAFQDIGQVRNQLNESVAVNGDPGFSSASFGVGRNLVVIRPFDHCSQRDPRIIAI